MLQDWGERDDRNNHDKANVVELVIGLLLFLAVYILPIVMRFM